MTVPVVTSATAPLDGIARSAALMRALGSRANAVWSTLSPDEAQHLTSAMESLPDNTATETAAARAYVRDMSRRATPATIAAPRGLWQDLSTRDGAAIAAMITDESPQIVAVILSRLSAEAAAAAVRALPPALATEALRRLLHLGEVQPAMVSTIEAVLSKSLSANTATTPKTGQERVARIFDSLETRSEQALLASLDLAEPGVSERIRALMFTFDDLATLDPASLQTLLAGIDRAVLILALKGAKDETTNAFFNNMTARARELLHSEITATGPVRRSEINAARAEIIALARTLVNRGDILSHEEEDEELIE